MFYPNKIHCVFNSSDFKTCSCTSPATFLKTYVKIRKINLIIHLNNVYREITLALLAYGKYLSWKIFWFFFISDASLALSDLLRKIQSPITLSCLSRPVSLTINVVFGRTKYLFIDFSSIDSSGNRCCLGRQLTCYFPHSQ